MEEFVEKIMLITEPKTIFTLCAILIFTDVITGYLKALKFRKLNSSVSRDGYIKKIGWVVALLLGYIVDTIIGVNILLVGSALVCIATEGISTYENFGELGIKLRFAKYFEKLNSMNKEEK